jgi:hypothetical protein
MVKIRKSKDGFNSGLDLLWAYEPPPRRWYGIANLGEMAAANNGDPLMSWRSFATMDAPGHLRSTPDVGSETG